VTAELPKVSYTVIFTATAQQDLRRIPPRIVPAIVEFAFGDLATAPQRLGRPLERELSGLFSARRGPYRVLYRIDGDAKSVAIIRVAHRADAYRPGNA
jgi:mRNA-degrading endonuclease RelE of RelBE toxin-antitoxin system